MDEFAKRGAIAAVSLIVVAGLGLGIGLYRFRAKLEHDSKAASASPRLAAALTFPAPVVAADTAPPPQVVSATKQDLASAFGAALGIDPSKVAARSAAPAASAASTPQRAGSSDTLELGFAASERNAKLNDRDSKAFDVRQNGGAEPEHKDKQPRERVSFVTDLGGPGGP